ncbi:MAG: nitronate monooxygenase [Desulfobacteraceae bacterium]|nr:nitronate monooxygenase [Desulfobacteraceae bacterium]
MKAPIQTTLTRMLGVEYPVIGAPMWQVSYEPLAIAVSKAGGLGCIALPNFPSPEGLQDAIKRIQQETERPFGVNLHLSGKFDWKSQLKICLDAGVKLFITALGNPAEVIPDVHANGGKVFTGAVSLKHALEARDRGVDGIIAVGAGAGGHGGKINTMVMVPWLVEKTGLPVIAAGGISTGGQMAAAFCLGACGVITGTRLVATEEAGVVVDYKNAVVEASPEDIVYTDRITGNYANWIRKSIEGFEGKADAQKTDWRKLWSAGQSVAQVKAVQPASAVIEEMVEGYWETVESIPRATGK